MKGWHDVDSLRAIATELRGVADAMDAVAEEMKRGGVAMLHINYEDGQRRGRIALENFVIDARKKLRSATPGDKVKKRGRPARR